MCRKVPKSSAGICVVKHVTPREMSRIKIFRNLKNRRGALFHLERERDRFRCRRCFRFRSRSRDLLRLRSIRRRAGRSVRFDSDALFVRSPAEAFLEGDLERDRDLYPRTFGRSGEMESSRLVTFLRVYCYMGFPHF